MPTWGAILTEIIATARPEKGPDFDLVRRKYLKALRDHTGRNTIIYATKFTQPDENVFPGDLIICDEDLQGFMETIHGLTGPDLDLILHSPGGSIDAAEAIVTYLRQKFSDIRVIVPQQAMSAAAMISCSANSILMGKHSFLGPTDPQFIMPTPLGQRSVPVQAILDQFDEAVEVCKDPSKLAAYLPMLAQYGPDLLIQAKNTKKYATELVREWLHRFMFAGEADGLQKATDISTWMSAHNDHGRHSRHISRQVVESKGLKVKYLEDDQVLQDLVLSIFHATTHTFTMAGTFKIIENHIGKAYIKNGARLLLQGQGAPGNVRGGPGLHLQGILPLPAAPQN
jgi:hypothetical protein